MEPEDMKPQFKKHNHVYAVVGGACCNREFRTQLFGAYDPNDIKPLRKVVNDFLKDTGGDGAISDHDLGVVFSFVQPRRFQPIVEPPLTIQLMSIGHPDNAPGVLSFESACEAFWAVVCPVWPCDNYSG
jgi:hypothetical protein